MSNVAETPTVEIVRNKTTGAVITQYKTKTEYGYIQLKSEVMETGNGWLRTAKRSTLLRAKVEELKAFVKHFAKDDKVPGVILIRECTESEIDLPEFSDLLGRLDKTKDREDAIEDFLKTTGGEDALDLTYDGERILRFSEYVIHPQAHHVDRLVQHDNVEEVAEWRKERAARIASQGADIEGDN